MVTQEVVAGAVAGSSGRCGRQREVVKSTNGSPGTRETSAGMDNETKTPDPCALSLAPFYGTSLACYIRRSHFGAQYDNFLALYRN